MKQSIKQMITFIINYINKLYITSKEFLTGEYYRKKENKKIYFEIKNKKQEEQNNYVSNKYLGYNNLSW